jgi:hypothetical protein
MRLLCVTISGPASEFRFTSRPCSFCASCVVLHRSPLPAASLNCAAPVPFVLYYIWYPSYNLAFTVWLILRLLFFVWCHNCALPLSSPILCGIYCFLMFCVCCAHGAQINFGDQTPYLTYDSTGDHSGTLPLLFLPVWFQLVFVCQVITK